MSDLTTNGHGAAPAAQQSAAGIANVWLDSFGAAMAEGDAQRVGELLTEDASWRDLVALSWHVHSWAGIDAIVAALTEHLPRLGTRAFRIDSRIPPAHVTRAGRSVVEAMFTFDSEVGPNEGVVRLIVPQDGGTPKAWTVMTSLTEIKGHEPRVGRRRVSVSRHDKGPGGRRWNEHRLEALDYEDREPAVLVVGAGQAGLSVAARLSAVGIETLVIDKHDRIGDNWRKRYARLRLHTETHANHLPFLPFPETVPNFLSAGAFANFLESYAEILELDVWTGTEFLGATYDEESATWTAQVRRTGVDRELRPRHIVVATGLSDVPRTPEILGIEAFRGRKIHSSQFDSGVDHADENILVFGAGNSGIDIAEDLYHHGARVTLVQRGPVMIIDHDPTALREFEPWSKGLPTNVVDLFAAADPYPALIEGSKKLTAEVREMDRDLIARLNAVGFRTYYGPDDLGNGFLFFTVGGGYYLNVGGADLIADGKIRIRQFDELVRLGENGPTWSDGSTEAVDAVVFATGYQSPSVTLKRWFGDEAASNLGTVWGFNEEGELNNIFKRTPQPGLWFIAGGLMQSRPYSHWLTLQLQAVELGLIPAAYRSPQPVA